MIRIRHCQPSAPGSIISAIIMAESIRISLRYHGPEVDAGEMNVDDVIRALQGFSGAYIKISSWIAPDARQELKVTAIKNESFDLIVLAGLYLASTGDLFEKIDASINVAKFAFGLFADVIGLKKHTKQLPYTARVDGDGNNVTIINAENVTMTVPLPAFEMYREKLLDNDLAKITNPLSQGRITEAELREEAEEGIGVTINNGEREYFTPESEVTTIKEQEVTGTLVSLNKKSNRGTFEFGNGHTARYLFVGDDKDAFHRDFAHKGPVKVTADIEFDENLTPMYLAIKRVSPSQMRLGLPEPNNSGSLQESE